VKSEALGDLTNVSWGNTSITKASYVPSGVLAYSASGPDGRLPHAEHRGPGLVVSAIGSVGDVYFAEGEWTAIKNTITITPREGREVDFKFLFYLLSRKGTWRARGGTQQFIGLGTAREVKVALPPLAEQRRIADVLDRAEALRAKRRAALAQLDSLTQSLFLDLFGDPATNPKNWPRWKLIALGNVSTGRTPPSTMEGMFGGPVPFVTPGALESAEPVKRSLSEAGAEQARTVRRGAAFVCCIDATIGKMGLARERSAFNQQINAVEWLDGTDDDYGLAALRFFKPTIKAWGASTTLPILKKSSFEKIELPLPPLQLQREFARRNGAVEKLKVAQRASLAGFDDLFLALQQRAFKGEL
jgi:type I restriction enzyme S subunit